MSKKKYENFTLSLALFDALPVIFFSISMIIFAINFNNIIFITGAAICTVSGTLKVIWKLITAGTKKDISILNKQMRILMPIGFLLMTIGIITGKSKFDFKLFFSGILSFPNILFFIITAVGMILMSVFAVKLDPTKAKSNWIEQITNAIAQFSLLIGLIITFN